MENRNLHPPLSDFMQVTALFSVALRFRMMCWSSGLFSTFLCLASWARVCWNFVAHFPPLLSSACMCLFNNLKRVCSVWIQIATGRLIMESLPFTEKQFNEMYSKPILASKSPKASPKELEAGTLALEALHRQVMMSILTCIYICSQVSKHIYVHK